MGKALDSIKLMPAFGPTMVRAEVPPPTTDTTTIQAEERTRLIARFMETGETAFLRAALCLARAGKLDRADWYQIEHMPPQLPNHRPKMDDNDAPMLMGMSILIGRFPEEKLKTIARKVAVDYGGGQSVDAAVKRLVRKWATLREPKAASAMALWEIARMRAGGYEAEADAKEREITIST